MPAVTSRFHHYALRVVSNGHFVIKLDYRYQRKVDSDFRAKRAPIVAFIAADVPIEKAESFEGGPRLDAIIREAEIGQMDLFPVKVDR